jgi:fibronectin type 3 domain-containing protein
MSKPALFWTLKPKWWAGGFEIMRVTTEKPRRYYGTTVDGENTHVKAADCRGMFDTQEAAEATIERVKTIRAQHAEAVQLLGLARNRAEKAERDAIDAVTRGEKPAPAKTAAAVLASVMVDHRSGATPRITKDSGAFGFIVDETPPA